MEKKRVAKTAELSPLQWQLMMKCWKMNLRPGQNSWWGRRRGVGALGLWAWKLRKLNGPGFVAALHVRERHSGVADGADGQDLHRRPMAVKTRKELLASVKPSMRSASARHR